jgi:WD40 repeat protein
MLLCCIASLAHLLSCGLCELHSGVPNRVMVLTDHSANVTDLAFSPDDTKLFTTSADGSVYEWLYGKAGRTSDFVVKGVPAMLVSCSPSVGTIVAYFETADERRPKATLLRKSSAASAATLGLVQPPFQNPNSISSGINKSLAIQTNLSANGMKAPPTPGVPQTPSGMMKEPPARKLFLVMFNTGKVNTADSRVLPVECSVTSIAFGPAEPSHLDRSKPGEVFVVGYADGRIVIAMLPLPLRVIDDIAINSSMHILARTVTTKDIVNAADATKTANAIPEGKDSDEISIANSDISFQQNATAVTLEKLDESKCRIISLHEGAVTRIRVSPTGSWLLTVGADGCVFMLCTSLRAKAFQYAPESHGGDNLVMLADRANLLQITTRIEQLEQHVSDIDIEKQRDVALIKDNMERVQAEAAASMKREIELRDELIVKGREEQTRLCRIMQEEIDSLKESHKKSMSELEFSYEKQIAQHNLYIQNMKQAYDEHLVHARMDMEQLRADTEKQLLKAAEGRESVIAETDKQKAILLQYCDYISDRNKEIFTELEDNHDVEKSRLRSELVARSALIEEMKQKNRTDIAVINRTIIQQKDALANKDMEILGMRQEIDVLMGKLGRLERSLQEATVEIQRRTEIAERWEYKSGVQQQQLVELERIRKALTSQLHMLREKLGPQSELLLKAEERLKEVDTEYGQSLQDLSVKEAKLMHQGSVVQLLQKQVRELRSKVSRKDHSIGRAMKVLKEFEMCLQDAKFQNGRKVTLRRAGEAVPYEVVNDNGSPENAKKTRAAAAPIWGKTAVIDVFTSTPEMASSLARLRDIISSSVAESSIDAAPEVCGDAVYDRCCSLHTAVCLNVNVYRQVN